MAMLDRTDHYAVLGLGPQATSEQIRSAYRALLRRNHPDTRPAGDPADDAVSTATLLQARAAYAVLRDPDRRADYDRTRAQRTRRPTSVRPPEMAFMGTDPDRPPIQAGPVRWHGSVEWTTPTTNR